MAALGNASRDSITTITPSIVSRKGISTTSQIDRECAVRALRYEDANEGVPPRKIVSLDSPGCTPLHTAHSLDDRGSYEGYEEGDTYENGIGIADGGAGTWQRLRQKSTSFGSAVQHHSIASHVHASSPRGSASDPASNAHPYNSPSCLHCNSHLVDDLKRDSGIAPSVSKAVPSSKNSPLSTTAPAPAIACLPSDPNNQQNAARSTTAAGAFWDSSVPTVVVQDEVFPIAAAERSRSPFPGNKGSTEDSRTQILQVRSASHPQVAMMDNFQGIQSTLPATSVDNISLEDLASNKVGFSTRGSLLFGGRKMQDLIQKQGDALDGATSLPRPVSSIGGSMSPESPEVRTVSPVTPDHFQTGVRTPTNQKRQGLVSGRRQPSVQMLQAAIHGGRVLSAEEITFSMKVRSMYEYGDEKAAGWITPISQSTAVKTTPDASALDTHKPSWTFRDLQNPEDRHDDDNWPLTNRMSLISKYSKTSNELAGGIEDWDNVDGRLVDRYGFIQQDRTLSRDSAMSITYGMQRVATSLRMEAVQPRRDRHKLARRLSTKRSSRSMPPLGKEWSLQRGPVSVHSVQSTNSRKSHLAFRSRRARMLAEAPDMLTFPPGLENIIENEDAGKTASAIKQREWAREEKWQKMATAVKRRNEGKGGGMHFEFDTSDPKLIERTWKGIPDRWRATAWHSFLSASAKRRKSSTTDEELIGQFHKLQESSCADDVQIDVDVPRTVQLHIMFRRRYRGGQRLLFRVLHAMALYFPEVGYVQGMASIAVTLLCYYDEETAFVMMVRLWQLRGLESFFKEDFAGLMAALAEFERDWLSGGDVAEKLNELGITSITYGTRWYLTLFNMSVPFPAQLRIWDVFMLLGDAPAINTVSSIGDSPSIMKKSNEFGGADLDVLHATSAALIDATRDIILGSDFENAMKVLTSFVPIRDEDVLMKVAKTEYKMRKKRAKL